MLYRYAFFFAAIRTLLYVTFCFAVWP